MSRIEDDAVDELVDDDEIDDEIDELVDDEADDEIDDEGDDVDEEATAAPTPRTKTRSRRRREWRQSERARRYAARKSVRFPIFTRSVLLWMLLFALTGIAFGSSGAFFWAHFNTQVNELREQTKDFDKRSADAQAQIEAMRNQAITDINNQIKPIAPYLAEAKMIQLAQYYAPYVWFVATLDEEGRPSVGSAFAIASETTSTLMITSFNTVKAASLNPAPDITIRKEQQEIKARLVAWDADRDLALIEVERGGMQILDWATDEEQAQSLGEPVFPVSGLGGPGATLSSGLVIDQSAAGFQHTAPIGTAMQGGPIVTASSRVLGVASTAYRPLGFDPGEIHYAVQINNACFVLLECGGGAQRKKK